MCECNFSCILFLPIKLIYLVSGHPLSYPTTYIYGILLTTWVTKVKLMQIHLWVVPLSTLHPNFFRLI